MENFDNENTKQFEGKINSMFYNSKDVPAHVGIFQCLIDELLVLVSVEDHTVL